MELERKVPRQGARGALRSVLSGHIGWRRLREAEQRYRRVVELSPDAIVMQQNGKIVLANRAAHALLGSPPVALPGSIHAMLSNDTAVCAEDKVQRPDGTEAEVEVHVMAFTHRGCPARLIIMRDITDRKKSSRRIAYLAHHDALTELPNRTLFRERLEHALSIAERPGRSLEILFIDLDRFKEINDKLGHAAGDRVLKETAKRLQANLRESDTVARLGGDEFVVLVENVDELYRGGTIAAKILDALAAPFLRERNPLYLTTSIGISIYPADGRDADTLLRKADLAMYRVKQAGRDGYRYYSDEMNLHAMHGLSAAQ